MCFLCDCGFFGRRRHREQQEQQEEQHPHQLQLQQQGAGDGAAAAAALVSAVPQGAVQRYPDFDYERLRALRGVEDYIMRDYCWASRQRDVSTNVLKVFVDFSPQLPATVKASHTSDIGWKFHISINEKPDNLAQGINIVKDILITRAVASFKVLHPDERLAGARGQAGKQVTIYASKNTNYTLEDWQRIVTEIEVALRAAGINPGPSCVQGGAKPERQVEGSHYFYFRFDEGQSRKSQGISSALRDQSHLNALDHGFKIEVPLQVEPVEPDGDSQRSLLI